MNLDPDLLRRILAGEGIGGYSVARDTPQFGANDDAARQAWADANPTGFSNGDAIGVNYKDPNREWYTSYDTQGNYLSQGDGKNAMTLKDAALFAAVVAGMGGLGGLFGGAEAALGGSDALASTLGGGSSDAAATGAGFVGEGALSGIPGWDAALAGGGGGSVTAAGAGLSGANSGGFGLGGAGGTIDAMTGFGTSGLGLGAGTLGAAASAFDGGGSSLLSGLGDIAGNLPWQNILGAALGAATSQDQTQTKTNAPWEPAQPFIKQQLAQGQALSADRYANPFSPQQKVAYNNMGGLLNTINGNAQGLMSGFNANASGANNYDRADPRRKLIGSSFDMSSFAPGLLNFFPKG